MIGIVVILGEMRYRCSEKRKKTEKEIVFKDWKDHVDTDLEELFIEDASGEFISTQILAMRGSRRLAQNQVMEREVFHMLREAEYARKL